MLFSLSMSHRFGKNSAQFPFCYNLEQRRLRTSEMPDQLAWSLLCQWKCTGLDLKRFHLVCRVVSAFGFQERVHADR